MPDAIAGLLGLAFRAGHLVPGAEMGLRLIRERKAGIALLDREAGTNTRKKVLDACNHYQVQVILLDAGVLGLACGRPGMSAGAVRAGEFSQQIARKTGEQGRQAD